MARTEVKCAKYDASNKDANDDKVQDLEDCPFRLRLRFFLQIVLDEDNSAKKFNLKIVIYGSHLCRGIFLLHVDQVTAHTLLTEPSRHSPHPNNPNISLICNNIR